MTRAHWLAALALCAACKQQADPPPPPTGARAAVMPATEVKRAQDACKAYVDKVCGCARTMPALEQPCRLARALPDAVQVGIEVGATADTAERDVRQVQSGVRQIARQCIEQLAKLPAAGCT
jgi:hypothetical protein